MLESPLPRLVTDAAMSSLPYVQHFEACLADLAKFRITSLHDAQVCMRRWVIRDKDPVLKAVLKRMERANSSDQTYAVLGEFKRALMVRGLFPVAP